MQIRNLWALYFVLFIKHCALTGLGLWGTRCRHCVCWQGWVCSLDYSHPTSHPFISWSAYMGTEWWIEISRWWWRSSIFCEDVRMHELWAVDLVSAIQHHLLSWHSLLLLQIGWSRWWEPVLIIQHDDHHSIVSGFRSLMLWKDDP